MTLPSVDESAAGKSSADESPARAAEERHATWLELFFDLVIVAAVAQLAHLLHEETVGPREIFLFAVLYYAMWSVWTSFTLYANVRGERTLQWTVLTAMFGIAVMAASIPQFVEGGAGYKYFVVAYIACRFLAVKSWQRASAVMAEWPAAQQFVPVIPWVSSLWGGISMHWHYFQWGVGILLDIAFAVALSRRPDRLLQEAQKQRDEERRRWTRRFSNARGPQPTVPDLPDVQIVHADRAHLGERLGLFVIIVLGEAVAQVVSAAAGVPEWHWPLALAGFSGFGLLVCVWYLTLQYGASAVPTATSRTYGLPLTLPTHYLMTASIVVIAAGLGTLAAHPDGVLSDAHRWVLCAGAAVYFLTASFIGARTGAPMRWLLGWGAPSVTVTLLLGAFGASLPGWAVAGILVLVAVWHILYRRDERAARIRPKLPESRHD